MGFRETLNQARTLIKEQFSPDKEEKKSTEQPETQTKIKVDDDAEWVRLNATISEDNIHKELVKKEAQKVFEKHAAEVKQAKALIAQQISQIDAFVLEDQAKAINEVLKEMKVDRDTEVGAVVIKTSADALVANMIKKTLDVNPPQLPEEIKVYREVVDIIKPLTPEGNVEEYIELKEKKFDTKTKKDDSGIDRVVSKLDEVKTAVEGAAQAQNVGNLAEFAEVLREVRESADQLLKRNTAPEPAVARTETKPVEKETKEKSWEELKEKRKELQDIDGVLLRDDAIKNKRELKEINEAMSQKWKKAQKELEAEMFYLKARADEAIGIGMTQRTQDPIEIAESYLDITAKGVENNRSLGKETKEIAKDWINNVKEKWELEKERELSRRTDVGHEDRTTFANNVKEKEREFKSKDWGKRSDEMEDFISSLAKKSADRDAVTAGTQLYEAVLEEKKMVEARARLTGMAMPGMGMDMDSESALKYTIWMNRLQLKPGDLQAVKDGNEEMIRTVFKRLVQRIEIDDDLLNDPNNLKFLLFYMDHELKWLDKKDLVKEILDFTADRIYFSQTVSKFDSLAQDDFNEQSLVAVNADIRANLAGVNGDRMGRLFGMAARYMVAIDDSENLKELFNTAKASGKLEDLQKFYQIIAQQVHREAWETVSDPAELTDEQREMVGEAKFAFRMYRFILRAAEVDAAYGKGTNLGPAYNGKNFQALLNSSFWFKRDIGNSKILQAAGQVEMYSFSTYLARSIGIALANEEISELSNPTDEEKNVIKRKYADSEIGINREGRVVNLTSIMKLARLYEEKICGEDNMSDEKLFEKIFADQNQMALDYFGKFKDAHTTRTKLIGIMLASPQDRIKMAGEVFKIWLHRAGEKAVEGGAVEDNGLGFSFFEDDYFSKEEAKKYEKYDKRHLAAMRMYLAIFEDAAAQGIDPMVLRYWAEKGIIENVGADRRQVMIDLLDLKLMKKRTMVGLQLGGLFWAIVSSFLKVTFNVK